MTILFYLKPSLTMPPSGEYGEPLRKKERKAQRKMLVEAEIQKKKRQEEEELILLGVHFDD